MNVSCQRCKGAQKSTQILRPHLGQSVEFCRLKRRMPAPCIHPSFTQRPFIPHTLPSARLCARVRVIKLSSTWPLPFVSLSGLERNFQDLLGFLFLDCFFLSCLLILTHPSELSHQSPTLMNNNLLFPFSGTPFLSFLPKLAHPAKLGSLVPIAVALPDSQNPGQLLCLSGCIIESYVFAPLWGRAFDSPVCTQCMACMFFA